MRDLTFYLVNMPPLPVPCLDVDVGTLYYRQIEAADLPSVLILSSPKPQKLDGKGVCVCSVMCACGEGGGSSVYRVCMRCGMHVCCAVVRVSGVCGGV